MLREYAKDGSETAFRQLVTQYVDLVYSTAIRRVFGDSHAAEDVVQTVFTDLARKAESLPENVMLGGWLHKHTCFVASNFRRTETRRLAREKEAAAMPSGNEEANWSEVEPALDDAIEQLDHEDRDAIVLRFFERRDFRAIGAAIGASENAAQKRVARALDKLRDLLAQRGVALSAAGLLAALSTQSIISAPAALADKAAISALANSGAKAAAMAAAGIGAWTIALWLTLAALGVGAIVFVKAPGKNASSANTAPLLSSEAIAPSAPAQPKVSPQQTVTSNPIIASTLRLSILAAGSDHPIPNAVIEYAAWTNDGVDQQILYTSRLGICNVPVPTNTTELRLTTRIEGFDDTRLLWDTAKGSVIPSEYILRLEGGFPIAGKVVNSSGQLVPNSTVRVLRSRDADYGSKIETYEFDGFEIIAENGTFQTSRIAKNALAKVRLQATHPDYISSEFVQLNLSPEIIEQFRTGELALVLKHGARVRGVVVNESAAPIADAEILVGNLGITSSRNGKSQPDGSFDIGGVQSGKTLLTVSATGYAATQLEIESSSAEPHPVVLKAGRTLIVRVVNQKGEPIENARAQLETLPYGPSETNTLPQLEYFQRTDADGRIRWNDAPQEKVKFLIDARGYMRLSSLWIAADGEEHTITMQPGLKVHGTVRDSRSGKPIPKFRLVAGWPERTTQPNGITVPIVWEYYGGKDFVNGQFRCVQDVPVVYGMKQDRYIFKVEAPGYLPEITRVVGDTEGAVEFNLALQPTP